MDEEIAYRILSQHDTLVPRIRNEIQESYRLFRNWIQGEDKLEWVEPQGGVTGFPRISEKLNPDMEKFHRVLLEKYETLVGPGRWFKMPENYMRIGFGWNNLDMTAKGLEGISGALKDVI